MFILLSYALAMPSTQVSAHIEILKTIEIEEIYPSEFKKLRPNKQHALAHALMEEPSFLAVLNRHKKGEGVVEGLARGSSTLHMFSQQQQRSYFLRHKGQMVSMLALERSVLFPIKDPFSINRAQTFRHSLEAYKRECKKFTPFKEELRYSWRGSGCSFGVHQAASGNTHQD